MWILLCVFKVFLLLLILYGEVDMVIDSFVSKVLYEKVSSKDKKFFFYKDVYYVFFEGELDEVIFRVFDDIIFWLDDYIIILFFRE